MHNFKSTGFIVSSVSHSIGMSLQKCETGVSLYYASSRYKYKYHYDRIYLLSLTLLYSATNRNLPIKTLTSLYTADKIINILLPEKLISLLIILTLQWAR
jgi:hypothetical protein